MEHLNERIHKLLDMAVTGMEEARNVSVMADEIVKFNQLIQGANMYCEFLARVNGLKANTALSEGRSEKKDQESPPS